MYLHGYLPVVGFYSFSLYPEKFFPLWTPAQKAIKLIIHEKHLSTRSERSQWKAAMHQIASGASFCSYLCCIQAMPTTEEIFGYSFNTAQEQLHGAQGDALPPCNSCYRDLNCGKPKLMNCELKDLLKSSKLVALYTVNQSVNKSGQY